MKSSPAKGCRTGTPGNMVGGPVRQPYAGVDFLPHSGIYEFGYRFTPPNIATNIKVPRLMTREGAS